MGITQILIQKLLIVRLVSTVRSVRGSQEVVGRVQATLVGGSAMGALRRLQGRIEPIGMVSIPRSVREKGGVEGGIKAIHIDGLVSALRSV